MEQGSQGAAARLPKGMRGLWHRITGQYREQCRQNEAEGKASKSSRNASGSNSSNGNAPNGRSCRAFPRSAPGTGRTAAGVAQGCRRYCASRKRPRAALRPNAGRALASSDDSPSNRRTDSCSSNNDDNSAVMGLVLVCVVASRSFWRWRHSSPSSPSSSRSSPSSPGTSRCALASIRSTRKRPLVRLSRADRRGGATLLRGICQRAVQFSDRR